MPPVTNTTADGALSLRRGAPRPAARNLMRFPIPDAALDDRLGFVGTSGSGKTYNAGAAVERILARGGRVIIPDPLGVWWGLGLADDGAKASPWRNQGKLVIFGGTHGDLPINEQAGALIGDVELPPKPGPDLVRWWAAKLPGTARMAEILIEAGPDGLPRDELAARLDMAATGGSFGTYLSRLAGPGLIDRSNGIIRLTAEVLG